jgi:hypothetical protein
LLVQRTGRRNFTSSRSTDARRHSIGTFIDLRRRTEETATLFDTERIHHLIMIMTPNVFYRCNVIDSKKGAFMNRRLAAVFSTLLLISHTAFADSEFYPYGQACEQGDNKACIVLLDECLANKAAACFYLGNSLALRNHIKHAIIFTRMACIGGITESCRNLPILREWLRILDMQGRLTV